MTLHSATCVLPTLTWPKELLAAVFEVPLSWLTIFDFPLGKHTARYHLVLIPILYIWDFLCDFISQMSKMWNLGLICVFIGTSWGKLISKCKHLTCSIYIWSSIKAQDCQSQLLCYCILYCLFCFVMNFLRYLI